MTNKKSTKKALLMSCLSLLLCMSMLVGTTFAWFTDSVSSTNNIIKAGNLDVNLYWKTSPNAEWAPVDANTNIFKTGTLWEPGHTEVVYLKVVNEGTLALKYDLIVNIASETAGKNVAGENFNLSDYILYNITNGVTTYANSAAARGDETGNKLNVPYNKASQLLNQGEAVELTMVTFMPTTVGNEANYQTKTDAPVINLGINLFATQYTYEQDSYGPDYDGDALVCDILATPDTLKEIMANAEPGTVIGLAAGRYDPISIPKDGLTLVANDALTDSLNINGHNDITIDGIEFQAFYKQLMVTKYAGNYTYEEYNGYMASITNTTSTSNGGNNIVIRNCRFYCNPSWVGQGYGENYVPEKYCAIAIEDQNRVSGPTTNVTIENCSFEAASLNHIRLDYVEGDVIIRNNKFSAPSAHHNINASGNDANWTITGNTFSNWADGEYAFGTNRPSANATTFATIKIVNNTFNKAMTEGESIPVLSIKPYYTAANSKIIIEDNEFNAGTATIGERDADGKYWMTAEETTVGEYADLFAALKNGEDVALVEDVNNNKQKVTNGQGATAYTQNGGVFDGNGHTLTATGLGGTWDSAIYTKGGTIKNVVIEGAMRGIFIDSTSAETVYLENVTSNCVYTINCNRGGGNGLVAVNCSFNGWTSFAASIGNVKFVDCSFGAGNGYNKSVPYATTEYIGCDFAEGHVIDARGAITFENCTINGQPLTTENLATLVTSNIANATVIG